MASVDLHGKTWAESLAVIIAEYNHTLQAGDATAAVLDIVHGYGSTGSGGTIRARLRAFLDRYPQRLEYLTGEAVDSNQGHTLVMPIQPLPEIDDLLAEQVWDYCERPRTLSKISGRFRRHGDPPVMQAIRTLEKQGRLRATSRGRVKVYEAV